MALVNGTVQRQVIGLKEMNAVIIMTFIYVHDK